MTKKATSAPAQTESKGLTVGQAATSLGVSKATFAVLTEREDFPKAKDGKFDPADMADWQSRN